ncbi:MAG: OmpH family outer membrane protein [Silicimonas sp.]|nr:OmpH family outer membrane protein [Silicimonas sp.]
MLALSVAPAFAQQTSPVLTIDQDRLFAETRLGAETLAELERQAQDLAAENTRIENELIAKERELTDLRATLAPEEFRAMADAFDERVQQLRAEQDEKARLLNRGREEARTEFFSETAVILSGIVREKGALVVIDRRDVFLSADRIDITDEAIERINAASEAAPAE